MVKSLEKLGYKTDLQYGDNNVQNQIAQIENMITKGVNVLVIASIDGSALTDVLQKAHDAKIPVIPANNVEITINHFANLFPM
jgi:putative multiple sugar transport system substrate-binding protein